VEAGTNSSDDVDGSSGSSSSRSKFCSSVTPRVTFSLIIFIISLIKHKVPWLTKLSRFEIRIQSHESNLKSQVLFSVDRYTHSANFQNLSESN
jgi:hypothetical protein